MEPPIVLLNEQAEPVGELPRAKIDKSKHIVAVAHALILDGKGKLALAELIDKPINHYGGRFATSAAGILRKGEIPEMAMRRTLQKELGILNYQVTNLGTEMAALEDGTHRQITAFIVTYNGPLENRDGTVERYVWTSREELDEIIMDRQLFSPAFLWIWERYGTLLPF